MWLVHRGQHDVSLSAPLVLSPSLLPWGSQATYCKETPGRSYDVYVIVLVSPTLSCWTIINSKTQVVLGWHWLLHLFYYTRWRHVSEGFESHAWQVMHDTGQTATVSTFRCRCSSYYIFKEYWNYNNCEELWLVTTLYTVLMMILPDLRYTCVGQCRSISI